MSSSNVLMTALVAATAVGAAAGLLLAPKPGKVTRRFVAMRAHKVRNRTEGYVGSLKKMRSS
ncbi:MAG TPA: YtxH domain-containing protein [Dehalococcoidia bacterium]|nr:YtxH domain-containing protein [Dehalococcoidia bacterium]